MDFQGRNIIITGAASGMGRETAKVLSHLRARVILLDKDEKGLVETCGLLESENHAIYVIDLLDVDKIAALVSNIVAENGMIDGLVHCAGITSRKPLNMLKPDGYMKIMTINVYSFIELVRCLSKKGHYKSSASFVAISSVSSIKGYRAKTEYCMSKAALDAAIRCLALELVDKGIRINSVMPGIVKTPMSMQTSSLNTAIGAQVEDASQPLGDTEPVEVANLISFLLSDLTKTITGATYRIDGGLCI